MEIRVSDDVILIHESMDKKIGAVVAALKKTERGMNVGRNRIWVNSYTGDGDGYSCNNHLRSQVKEGVRRAAVEAAYYLDGGWGVGESFEIWSYVLRYLYSRNGEYRVPEIAKAVKAPDGRSMMYGMAFFVPNINIPCQIREFVSEVEHIKLDWGVVIFHDKSLVPKPI